MIENYEISTLCNNYILVFLVLTYAWLESLLHILYFKQYFLTELIWTVFINENLCFSTFNPLKLSLILFLWGGTLQILHTKRFCWVQIRISKAPYSVSYIIIVFYEGLNVFIVLSLNSVQVSPEACLLLLLTTGQHCPFMHWAKFEAASSKSSVSFTCKFDLVFQYQIWP